MTPDGDLPALGRTGWDRHAAERDTDGLLDRLREDASTRVLVIRGDAAALADEEHLAWASAGDVAEGAEWAFLGRDDDGAGLLAAVFPADAADPAPAPAGWGALRMMGHLLGAAESGAFVEALSLGRWLLDAAYCPACGTRTELRQAGWSRLCPACGREHFPRTDPAAIVAVASQDGSRLLLGSNVLWGLDRFSCFAGFAEAGESLESAVVREVEEEAGVRIATLRYGGSQAWPYPRSLMVGFHARVMDDAAAEADGAEIAEVRWFTRDEIGAGLAGDGGVILPGPVSIAHSLIRAWHAGNGA